MSMRIQGSVDLTISFPGESKLSTPPPDGTTPCGACQYQIQEKLFTGICQRDFGGYPVTDFAIELAYADGTSEKFADLKFIRAEDGTYSSEGGADDIMTQRLPVQNIDKVLKKVVVTWTDSQGKPTIPCEIVPRP